MNQLFEEDYGIRVETAEALLPYNYDPSMENFIFFDEATFDIYLAMFTIRIVEYGAHKN